MICNWEEIQQTGFSWKEKWIFPQCANSFDRDCNAMQLCPASIQHSWSRHHLDEEFAEISTAPWLSKALPNNICFPDYLDHFQVQQSHHDANEVPTTTLYYWKHRTKQNRYETAHYLHLGVRSTGFDGVLKDLAMQPLVMKFPRGKHLHHMAFFQQLYHPILVLAITRFPNVE